MEKSDNGRDALRDSTDPEITRRLYQTLIPEWLMPNVRLKLQHFLPKEIKLKNSEQDYVVYFNSLNEKMEVYAFVRRLFEEHNSWAELHKQRPLYINTAYLFCMDVAESSVSSNFFQFIPRYYYRRYLEDVPLFYSTKACIIVDYHRRVAYRFGLSIGKMMDEIDGQSEERTSLSDSVATSVAMRGLSMQKRKMGDEFFRDLEKPQITMEDIMKTNMTIHLKRNEVHQ